jgi:hypothetical protein
MPDTVGWPSAIVAVALVLVVGVVDVVAISKYASVDDALKFAAVWNAVVAVFSGAFVTYFFTKSAKDEAARRATAAQRRGDRLLTAMLGASPGMNQAAWDALKGELQRIASE